MTGDTGEEVQFLVGHAQRIVSHHVHRDVKQADDCPPLWMSGIEWPVTEKDPQDCTVLSLPSCLYRKGISVHCMIVPLCGWLEAGIGIRPEDVDICCFQFFP
ncbi:MAG: hypothetical protein A4E42_00380 [Methanoregulaceae archaeon PtaU1.Bin222]|nr:MAG: hypothetical protein A4E42_00380 [Methanoregulaceae archaeon PtaU1.Bin222]